MSPKEENDNSLGNPKTRRRHRRIPTREVTVEVKYRGTAASYSVKNISTGGMLVAGARSLPKGAAIDVELQLKGAKPVKAVGTVLYEVPEGMGVAFQPFSSDVALAMEKFIAAVDAKNAMPPPLPSGPRPPPLNADELPPVGPRPTDDPFLEGADPRPPRSGLPDERLEYLRTLVKHREEALKRGRAMLNALVQEADAVRAVAARLKSKLDLQVGQAQLNEAALAGARKAAEQQMESQLQERATAEARLEDQQRQTLEAIAAVSGLEAKIRRQEAEVQRAKEEAEAARREAREFAADAASLRRAREELALANKKAMEAQALANKERTGVAALEKQYADLRGAYHQLNLERTQLKEEVQKLKSKLIAAENALESRARKPASPARR